jgi:hypothetical protein
MSFAFPPNPNPGDTYTGPNNVEYTWDGTKWVGVVAPTGGGGGDELLEVETTVTDADVSLAVNTHNVLTVSGLTALRTALFPAGAKGDVIEVELATKAPADYELLIAGDTGVSMRLRDQVPVTAAEVTRLLILGEAMRWVHDGTDWVCTALDDGRIPSFCSAWLSATAIGETANVMTIPTDKGGAWTWEQDNAEMARLATSAVRIRRANSYSFQTKATLSKSGSSIGVAFMLQGEYKTYNITYSAPGYITVYIEQQLRFNPHEEPQYAYRTSGGLGLAGGSNRLSYFFVRETF